MTAAAASPPPIEAAHAHGGHTATSCFGVPRASLLGAGEDKASPLLPCPSPCPPAACVEQCWPVTGWHSYSYYTDSGRDREHVMGDSIASFEK